MIGMRLFSAYLEMATINIRKLEAELWESADLLRQGSKLTSNQYCMPVLGLIFLRYAFGRFKLVEAEIQKNRPVRNGRKLPVEPSDFAEKSALYLPPEARYDYLVNLPTDIVSAQLKNQSGQVMSSLGEVVNNAMELVEAQSEQLKGVLPKDYTMFTNDILSELLRIFNNSALDEVGGDILGRIYEYFLNKFAKNIASDDGVFFTPKSLVKMIVNVLEPKRGILLDPACGSGGMFVQTGDFVNHAGMSANSAMTFYGQEKVECNAQLCLMNMAVHGLNGIIQSGNEANVEALLFHQPCRDWFQRKVLTDDPINFNHQVCIVRMLPLCLQLLVNCHNGVPVGKLMLCQIITLQVFHYPDKLRGIGLKFLFLLHGSADSIRACSDERLFRKAFRLDQGSQGKSFFLQECIRLSNQLNDSGYQDLFVNGRIRAALPGRIGRVVGKGFPQCLNDTDVIDDQAIALTLGNTVCPGNGLHQRMCFQGLVQIQAG